MRGGAFLMACSLIVKAHSSVKQPTAKVKINEAQNKKPPALETRLFVFAGMCISALMVNGGWRVPLNFFHC